MKKTTEEKALEQLGINRFRELSKGEFLDFLSGLSQMDPEVQIKALDQFPEFISSAKEYLSGMKETVSEALRSGEKGMEYACEGYMKTIDSVSELIERGDLTFEEKMEIAQKMIELNQKISEEADRHRRFVESVHTKSLEAGLAAVALGVVALGGKMVVSRVL